MYTTQDHQIKVNKFEDKAMSLLKLYEKKNWDYSDSFAQSFQKWGLPMTCIRLGDKLNRLESFAQKKDIRVTDTSDSLKDTLADLAAYAIMTLIELDEMSEAKVSFTKLIEDRES